MNEVEQEVTRPGSNRKGLVMVNTGRGKGKTTAALGVLFRAWGWGWRICVIQFIKHEKGNWGEVRAARKLGIEWHALGDGFTWRSKDLAEAVDRARAAWELARAKIASSTYDLIILDEMTHALRRDWLNVGEVVAWLRANKPPALHLIITGRDAPPELVAFADLVTEMRKVKHPYDRGIRGQRGIEF